MIVLAHAGHWAVQLIYLFPLAVLVGVILVGRARDRREAAAERAAAGRREAVAVQSAAPGREGVEDGVEDSQRLHEGS